jgi:hypothetical protein
VQVQGGAMTLTAGAMNRAAGALTSADGAEPRRAQAHFNHWVCVPVIGDNTDPLSARAEAVINLPSLISIV